MKALTIQKSPDDALKDIVSFLFEKKDIGGVFTLAKKNKTNYTYALITDKRKINCIAPSFPVMPMNAGKMISQFTITEPTKTPLAIILRPCELRALYELVKLEQANLDNLLFISFTCNGVFPLGMRTNGLEKKVMEYWEKVHTGEQISGLRESCMICEDFVPDNADIILALAGNNTAQTTRVLLKTVKGEEYLQGMNDKFSEKNLESQEIETIKHKRSKHKQKVFTDLKTEELGWNGLIKLFGRCINCHACGSVCPICYCKLCYIDSTEKDIPSLSWESQLNRNGTVRIPDDTVMYHLVRLLHVGIMCVGCGMCSDVCPTSIPIASIFAKFGDRVQKDMQYTPGKDLTQKMPLADVNPKDFVDLNIESEKE